MRNAILAVLCCALAASGCKTINAQAKAATDRMLGEHAPASAEHGDRATRMTWAEGQWAVYRITTPDGPAVYRISVVGREGDAFWIEVAMFDYYQAGWQKMLISGYDAADVGTVKQLRIRRLIMWQPYGEQKEPTEMPPFMAPMVEGALRSMVLALSDAPPQTVTVPAGTFAARTQHATVQLMGVSDEVDVWLNGAVPVWGIVKQVSKREHVWELLAFGTSGAKAEVPEPKQPAMTFSPY
jgi:hypothetical protein